MGWAGWASCAGTQWGLLCAASMLIAAPPILLALIARRRLVTGLTFGAVK